MSDCPNALSAKPLPAPTDARAARLEKFQREQLIVDYLNRGVSVAEIAARVGVGEKRLRAIMREILARRMPRPPMEFVAIQVSRLNEALLVAFSAMSPTNLKAVDQVVKIVRELDRYGGAFAAEWARPEAPRLDAPAEEDVAFAKAWLGGGELEDDRGGDRPENSAQGLERIDSAPGNADAAAASRLAREAEFRIASEPDDREVLAPAGADPASSQGAKELGNGPAELFASGRCDRPENPAQLPDNMDSAPETARPAAAPVPFDVPMILTPTGWKPATMRMLQNGVAA